MLKKIMIIVATLIIASILFADYQSDLQEAIEKSKAEGYSESEQQVAVAVCHYNYGKFEEALETLSRADSMGIDEKWNSHLYSLYSGIYRELGDYKKALEYNEKVLKYWNNDTGSAFYPNEFRNLYYKYMLGENIEDEKKDFLSKWKVENEINQYALCDFLLKVEDYEAALQAIKDYDKMLIKLELTETNIQYILFVHAYYELGNYKKAKEYFNLALAKSDGDNNSESYLHYWNSLINYAHGNKEDAIISLQKGKSLDWGDYRFRFVLLDLWRFTDKNVKILEEIEKSAAKEYIVSDSSSFFFKYFDLNESNIEINCQAQINQKQYYGNFNLFNVQFALRNSALTIGGSQIKFSTYTSNKKTHLSLNSCSILIVLMALTFDRDEIDNKLFKSILRTTAYGMAIPNTLLNMQLQLKLDKEDNFRIFVGTTGDLFLIEKESDIKYTFITGISIFRPVELKVFYAKDINSLKGVTNEEYVGISLGLHLEY